MLRTFLSSNEIEGSFESPLKLSSVRLWPNLDVEGLARRGPVLCAYQTAAPHDGTSENDPYRAENTARTPLRLTW